MLFFCFPQGCFTDRVNSSLIWHCRQKGVFSLTSQILFIRFSTCTSISRVARPSPYPIIRLLMHVILALGIAPWAFLLAARRACTGSASPCFSCSATSTCPFHDALSFKVTMFCLAKACLVTPRSKKRSNTFLVEEYKMGAHQIFEELLKLFCGNHVVFQSLPISCERK